jgi:hypothetical protein
MKILLGIRKGSQERKSGILVRIARSSKCMILIDTCNACISIHITYIRKSLQILH